MFLARKTMLALRAKLFSRRMFRRNLCQVIARNRLRPQFESLEERRVLATVTWIAAGGGNFNVPGNWDLGVPGVNDDVVIPDLVGTPTITINGGGADVRSITADERIDLSGAGGIRVTQASSFNAGLNITGGSGTLRGGGTIILGGTSIWQGSNPSIGSSGVVSVNGVLVIDTDGGTFTVDGSLSAASGSNVQLIGNNPLALNGSLVVASGGTLNPGVNITNPSVTGIITNAGTLLRTSSSTAINIAAPLNNTGTVRVSSGFVTLTGGVTQYNSATDTLSAGTWIANGTGNLRFNGLGDPIATLSGTANVTVGDTGSWTGLSSLGNVATGATLTVSDGADVAFLPSLNFVVGGNVTVSGASSRLRNTLGASVTQVVSGGNVTLAGGGQLDLAGAMEVQSGGTLNGDGTVQATFGVSNAGTIAPGASPGIINIIGNYAQTASGSLDIEVQGTNPITPDFDQLLVSGTATLDGTLNVSLLNNFYLDRSETLNFMTFASRSGDFATKSVPVRNGLPLVTLTPGLTNYSMTGNAYIVRNTANGGAFSLRNAISSANVIPGTDQILFNIAGNGVHTISPTSPLPTITQTLLIDATSESDYAGVPRIELDGTGAGAGVIGLTLNSSNNLIAGLTINRFGGSAIVVTGAVSGNTIRSNYIGTDSTGTAAIANAVGVQIDGGANNNTIGGTTAADRNIISGNTTSGVIITGVGSSGNKVFGNYIGVGADGSADIGNDGGVTVQNGAAGNFIGSGAIGAGNVIAGNAGDVVLLADDNKVQNNRISVNAGETSVIAPSFGYGVYVALGASGNVIGTDSNGTTDDTEGNIIGYASTAGILVQNNGGSPDGTIIAGNRIGLASNGTTLLNSGGVRGIWLAGATNTRIGSDADGSNDQSESNVIVNPTNGASIFVTDGTDTTLIAGNYLGTNATGTAGLATGGSGIVVQSLTTPVTNTVIGGNTVAARNVISSMTYGVVISGAGTAGTLIIGNHIGTDKDGTAPIGNVIGVSIESGATGITVGGNFGGTGNVISGNQTGLGINDSNSNTILGNYIGLASGGLTQLANTQDGVTLSGTSASNTIGSTLATGANYISGNTRYGIAVTSSGASNNVLGNVIGLNVSDQIRGNGTAGIINNGGAGITIGGNVVGSRNVISGNPNGVWLVASANNAILGNYIGTDGSGALARGNTEGIVVDVGSTNNSIGGGTTNTRNIISGNTGNGVYVNTGTSGTVIQGNYIGTALDGTSALGNAQDGIQTGGPVLIGGLTATPGTGVGNVISGNGNNALNDYGNVYNGGATGVVIQGNIIGLDKTGTNVIRQATQYGIWNYLANGTTIGGATTTARNVISGNGAFGLLLQGGSGSLVQNNYIGTDISGDIDKGNTLYGISTDTRNSTFRGNVISGNDYFGMYISGQSPQASNIQVVGNIIGLNATGTAKLGNTTQGLVLDSIVNVTVGGTTATDRNIISGNSGTGIAVGGTASTGIVIQGNYIGLGADGVTPLGNPIGLDIAGDVSGTVIGGTVAGAGNVISGNDGQGILLDGSTTVGTLVQGNFIGTDRTGSLSRANNIGIQISGGADNNTIGGSTVSARNVISGNVEDGISIVGVGTSQNKVQGNFIGTDALGTTAVGNSNGMTIDSAGTGTIIGVDGDGINDANEGNLISGNLVGGGVRVIDTDALIIAGNIIGLNASGSATIPNESSFGRGIVLSNSDGSRIGTNADGVSDALERNVIAGNEGYDVQIDGTTSGSVVAGNYIGVDSLGTTALSAPGLGALVFFGGNNNRIGTNADGLRDEVERNVMAGMGFNFGASNNSIAGNYIGTDKTGLVRLPIASGVDISAGAGAGNLIGGPTLASRNVIAAVGAYGVSLNFPGQTVQNNFIGVDESGNGGFGDPVYSGIRVSTANHTIDRNVIGGGWLQGILLDTTGNTIAGNLIGTNATGTSALPNQTGIQITTGGSNNTIGGTTAAARNVISGNTSVGISISGVTTTANTIVGNFIGTNAAGNAAIANEHGVITESGGNTIGGTSAGSRNVISGNNQTGVWILFPTATGNSVLGNYIGTNADASSKIGNSRGVVINNGADGNLIGGTVAGAGNVISGNTNSGVLVENAGTDGNLIRGNLIGTSADGTAALSNNLGGVIVGGGATSTEIGGTIPGSRNIISGNIGPGVTIVGLGTTGNTVINNYIGTDESGANDVGNLDVGLLIDAGAVLTTVRGNIISGNDGGGLLIAGASTQGTLIAANRLGTNQSGSLPIANGKSGAGNARFAISVDAATNNTIGGTIDADRNLIAGNIGDGLVLRNGASVNVVQRNWFGVDSTGLNAIPNSIHAVHLAGASTSNNTIGGLTAADGNLLAYSGGSALRLEDNTSTTVSSNVFTNNRLFGNLGLAIDVGPAGLTPNDGNDNAADLRDFPVLTESLIDLSIPANPRLIVKGFAQPGRRIDLFVSSPTSTGRGQGETLIGTFTEGVSDLDNSNGSYGAPNGVGTIAANRFQFNIPLPDSVRYGTLVTGLSLGSISEFGNTVPAGLSAADVANNIAPVVTLGSNVILVTGSTFQLDGSFLDDDSTSWTATVDYGDGTAVQPLALDFTERNFSLEHIYQVSSVAPYPVTVTVYDNGGKFGTASLLVSVVNESPVLNYNDFTLTPIANEGGRVTLQGFFSDSGFSDQHVVTIDWGDGNVVVSNTGNADLPNIPVGARTFFATHTYIDDKVSNTRQDPYDVKVTVSDGSATDTSPTRLLLTEIFNVQPNNLNATLPNTVVEDQSFVLSGTFFDPGILDSHEVVIDWGDGTPKEKLSLPSTFPAQTPLRNYSFTHKYADNPESPTTTYDISIEVTDDDEPLAPVVLKKQITVANSVPVVTGIVLSTNSVQESNLTTNAVSLSASFTDAGTLDSHQVVVDWGDGSEQVVRDLAPGVLSIAGLTHIYRDDPSGNTPTYTVTVKVADKDMASGVYSTATTSINVSNVAPVLTGGLKIFTRDAADRNWVEYTGAGTPTINEGDRVRITGSYSDQGPDDVPVINVTWSSGITTAAIVNPSNRSFEAIYRYTDDYTTGTAFDIESISVVADDQDGGVSAPLSRDLRINNVAPIASYLPGVVDNQNFIPLKATSFDPGTEELTYTWNVFVVSLGGMVATLPIQSQSSNSKDFTVDRTGFLLNTLVVELVVRDDDLGSSTAYRTAFKIGADDPNQPDNITVVDGDFPAGIDKLTVLALDGSDIIDASAVSVGKSVILDGGKGTDHLFGGSGDDIFILRGGNDNANVPGSGGGPSTPNEAGKDSYFLRPNSTFTIVDKIDDNSLNFSIADFGIAFDLSRTVPLAADYQTVATGHAVSAQGRFTELVGSDFGDTLTGLGGATVSGGDGIDQLYSPAGTTTLLMKFSGGNDADVLTVPSTSIVSEISFEGDLGADIFNVEGRVTEIDFGGGADADVLTIVSGSVVDTISFEGDLGADVFDVLGSVNVIDFSGGSDADVLTIAGDSTVGTISFEGDQGADEFTILGEVTNIDFSGGADVDVLTIRADSIVGEISFEGDQGADEFTVSGVVNEIDFSGGSDVDVLTIEAIGIVNEISFEGDLGQDRLIVKGQIKGNAIDDANIPNANDGRDFAIYFRGGSDADVLTINPNSVITSIDFEGDFGADVLTVFGEVTQIDFSGGSDTDVLGIGLGSTVTEISFEGDLGADELTVFGEITKIDFSGGADADVLTIGNSGTVDTISFEGDFGADELTVSGIVTLIDFGGGADADILTLGTTGTVDTISFEGDEGADVFSVFGRVTEIDFGGGADADVLNIASSGIVNEISFEGDGDLSPVSGPRKDRLIILGRVLGDSNPLHDNPNVPNLPATTIDYSIYFRGGADADVLGIGSESVVTTISFEGDLGADVFRVEGTVTEIDFSGGSDADVFTLSASGTVNEISFEGDQGADALDIFGTVINIIDFSGGADDDRFRNYSSGVNQIRFIGNDGNDIFLSRGSSIGQISFEGDLGADVLQVEGSSIGTISFQGDDGADVLLIGGSLINVIDFAGGADADVLSISGTEITTISFEGDLGGVGDGNDTFINRATASTTSPSSIYFRGRGGVDAFRNDGAFWDRVTFIGDEGADVFQNNGSLISEISFEGDNGDDVFENNGSDVIGLVFNGGTGRDIFINDGDSLSKTIFFGGSDADVFLNTGSLVNEISFEGDEGADIFTNLGDSVTTISFEGDTGDDQFINAGLNLTNAKFWGGAGRDYFVNRNSGVGAHGIYFYAHSRPVGDILNSLPYQASAPIAIPVDTVGSLDDSADVFLNYASQVSIISFEGDSGDDIFQNSGAAVSQVTFLGGADDDQALNTGIALSGFSMIGGDGDDIFENRGANAVDLAMDGGKGNDSFYQRGDHVTASANAVAVFMLGGDDVDVLANFGNRTTSIKFDSGAGNDRLMNSANDVGLVWLVGGAGNDALQNNGDNLDEVRMQGDADQDSLFNNGSFVRLVDFDGGMGANTLINTGSNIGDSLAASSIPTGIRLVGGNGADLLRTQGTAIVRVVMDGGSGDDSLLYNATGTRVEFIGGTGNDVFSYRGSASSVSFEGRDGDDRVVYSGTAPNTASPTVALDGGLGDDRYEFAAKPQGFILVLDDLLTASSDTSQDTIDFSAFTSGNVNFDLALITPQPQLGNLTIQLSSGLGIERIIGGSGADLLSGNARDNYIGGAQYFYPSTPTTPVPERTTAQWVYLDFDTYTNSSSDASANRLGEHVYTPDERTAIQKRIEATYYGYEADGVTPRTYFSPNRWFNVRFTQLLSDITSSGITDYVTIKFNETPSTGRPGGESSEIDPGNQSNSGSAIVQVNGLLGGIEVPVAANKDFTEQLPEDAEQAVGQDKPPATSENFVALSSKIAAHELAHLLGLRHYDSFGPIGFGIHSPPGVATFKPQYQGASSAFETFDHIIGSPASIGSDRANDVGLLFFGEREAIKIATSMSNASQVIFAEGSLPTTSVTLPTGSVSAKRIDFATIQVPNTLARGLNSAKSFYVQAAGVVGSIGLLSGTSENDYYTIAGQLGDTLTIEVSSQSLKRFTNTGVNGYIDSIVRLRDATGNIVQFFNSDAVNDDEFESSDSLLMDVRLPSTGIFTIEVDTFFRPSTDPLYPELIETIEALQAISNRTPEQSERLARLIDSRDNTDVGSYQLFIYNFAKANQTDGIDTLIGREGIDIIDGGPGEDYSLRIAPLANGASLEGNAFSRTVAFTNPGADSWTATVEYGDDPGTADVVNYAGFTPQSGLPLSHVYRNNGSYTVSVLLRNDDGQQVTSSFIVNVANVAPIFEAGANETLAASQLGIFNRPGIVITDPGADVWTGTVNYGDSSANVPLSINQSTKQFSLTHVYSSSGSFTVVVTVSDGDTSYSDSFVVTVLMNLPPVAFDDSTISVEAGGINNSTTGVNPSGNVLANDTDPNAGDSKTVIGVAAGVIASASANVAANVAGTYGTIQISATGSFTYTLNNSSPAVQALRTAADTLTDLFTYTMQDSGGLTSTAQVIVTIRGANDSASIGGVSTGAVTEDATVTQATGTLTVTDPDAGQAIFQTPSSLNGTYGTFTFNAATGVWVYTLDNARAATDALVAGQVVNDTLTVLSLDGTANRVIVITITGAGAGSINAKSIYVLNTATSGSLAMSGNAQITIPGPVYVNSSSSTAARLSGNARITASQVRIVGGAQVTGNARISPAPVTGVAAAADPLALLPAPTGIPATSAISCSGNSNITVNPGSYTSISASGNCRIVFSPGIYIIDGGGFSVSGNANVSGNGVMFYNAGSNFPNPGGTFGSISFSGNGQFNFNPSTVGTYSGVTFFQARDNTAQVSLSGNSIGMKGTLYAPKSQLVISGNGQISMTLIVDRFTMSGNATSALTAATTTPSSGSSSGASSQYLITGVLRVSIEDESVQASPEQLARIRDAISSINVQLGSLGLSIVEVDPTQGEASDVRLKLSSTSPCGGLADGILGCSSGDGEITIIQGWDWYTSNDELNVASDKFDYQTIVTHELGHAAGLEHSTDAQSVMFQSLRPGVARRQFTAFDLSLMRDVHETVSDETEPEALRAATVPPKPSKEHMAADWLFRSLTAEDYDDMIGGNRRKRR